MYLLAFFIDALRYDYVNSKDTPFLFQKIQEGKICALRSKPILGFTHSAMPSIWTGTYPCTHGRWVYWGYVKGKKADVYPVNKVFRIIPLRKVRLLAKHGFSYLLHQLKSPATEWFMPNVPDKMLPLFCRLTPIFNMDQSVGSIPTLFGILRKKKIGYCFRRVKSLKKNSLNLNVPNSNKETFVDVLSHSHLDEIGHIHGPLSPPVREEVHKLDSYIKDLFEKLARVSSDWHVLIFTDHGMANVVKRFDLSGLINTLGLRPGKDYVAFYDSTMARFWFLNEKARLMIVETLRNVQYGRILDKQELEKVGLNFEDNRYGDLTFQMNVGYEIFPNYFVSILPRWIRPRRGMHGFDVEHVSQQGILMYYGHLRDRITPKIMEIVDILPTILDILKLPIPSYCEGVSAIE